MRISVRTFAPNSIPIRFETTEPYYFWRTRPNNKKDKNNNSTLLKFIETTPNNKMSSDMRSVPTSCSKMVAYDGIKYCTISVKSRKRRRWEQVMHGWTAIINICRPKKNTRKWVAWVRLRYLCSLGVVSPHTTSCEVNSPDDISCSDDQSERIDLVPATRRQINSLETSITCPGFTDRQTDIAGFHAPLIAPCRLDLHRGNADAT